MHFLLSSSKTVREWLRGPEKKVIGIPRKQAADVMICTFFPAFLDQSKQTVCAGVSLPGARWVLARLHLDLVVGGFVIGLKIWNRLDR